MEQEKLEETIDRVLHQDAKTRLNKMEVDEPEQADLVKGRVFAMAQRGEATTGSVSDDDVTSMLKQMAAQEAESKMAAQAARRRFDDSDSDIDLDGL